MVWNGNRDLEAFLRPIGEMIEDPDNARIHPENNMDAIRSSLLMLGQYKPIMVWRNQAGVLMVMAGNGTYRSARDMGWTHIAVTEFEGDEIRARAAAIVDNRTSELSQWHAERLEFQTSVIAQHWNAEAAGGVQWSPETTGIAPDFAAGLIAGETESPKKARSDGSGPKRMADDGMTPAQRDRAKVESSVDIDVEVTTTIQTGDLFALGKHLIICGDATDGAVYDLLMGTERAELMHADPPYGMNKGSVANDDLHGADLDAFQINWWKACRPFLKDNGSGAIWGNPLDLWRLWFSAKTGADEPGLAHSEQWITLRNEIVWDKATAPGMLSDEMRGFPISTERALFFQLGEQVLNIDAVNYWEGFEPLRAALAAELVKTDWKSKKVQEILGSHMWKHYGTKSQWCMITEEPYAKLTAAGAEYNAFQTPYAELRAQYEVLVAKYNKEIRDPFYAARSFFDLTHDNMAEVWSFPRVVGEERYGHDTPKPVGLMERLVKSACSPDGIVLEPFAGTGTTLIACENSGRACRTIEINPAHVATTIARWEKVFKGKAELLSTR